MDYFLATGTRDKAHKLDFIAAIMLGFLFSLTFPPYPLEWLAWFSLAPLFKLLENKGGRTAFSLGLTWGIAHFVGLIYWIVVAVGHYGKMSLVISVAPMTLLALYLALYPAIFCGIVVLIKDRALAAMWIPCLWVALEYGRAKLLTGFPWCLIGYSQYNHPWLIQAADLFGVYGLSFVITLTNWYLYDAFLSGGKRSRIHLFLVTAFTFLCLSALLWYGHRQLHGAEASAGSEGTRLRVAIVQPSIDQSIKWDPKFQNKTMELYETLTRSAAESSPDLVVWPETATPFFFQANVTMAKRIVALSRELRCAILFGSPAYEETSSGTAYFNRAYLITPDQTKAQYYDKVHLVPFGEYVPLRKFLFFMEKLVPGAGNFRAGSSIRPLRLKDLSFGVLICFEAIFPDISRVEKTQGAAFFVNLTNDAWFGDTSAPYQHLAMSVFRAVENRVPLLRAANTGFSAIIDPYGRIKQKSGLFTKQILAGYVRLPEKRTFTFYTIHGDLFARLAALISVFVFVFALFSRKKKF